MTGVTVAPVPDVVRRYFDGVNHEDWDDFRGIWCDDAVIEVVGGVRVQGWEQILPYYTRALSGFPVHHDDPYRIHVAGDVITVEIAFTGETADGVPATFEAVDVFTLDDGRVRKLTTWYDLDRVLGFLRAPGAPERRLRTLARHAAASSPYYRRRFEELSLDADAVADDLSSLPATRLDGIAVDELVAVPEREVTHLVARGTGWLPLTRADVAERGRIWGEALTLAGIGRGDVVLARCSSPGLPEGVAASRARLAFASDPDTSGGTVVVRSARGSADVAGEARAVTVLELPEAGVVASQCGEGALHAHTGAHLVEIADGELVVTSLGARAVPLLRFATGVHATWLAQPCPCGSELPALRLDGGNNP